MRKVRLHICNGTGNLCRVGTRNKWDLGAQEKDRPYKTSRGSKRGNDVTRSWKVEYEGGAGAESQREGLFAEEPFTVERGSRCYARREYVLARAPKQVSGYLRREYVFVNNRNGAEYPGELRVRAREYFLRCRGDPSRRGLEGVLLKEVAKAGGFLVSKSVVMIFATLLTLFIQNTTRVKRGS